MRSRYLILFIALMFCLFMTGAFIALYDEEITVEHHNITSPDQDDHFMVVKKHNRLNNSVELYTCRSNSATNYESECEKKLEYK